MLAVAEEEYRACASWQTDHAAPARVRLEVRQIRDAAAWEWGRVLRAQSASPSGFTARGAQTKHLLVLVAPQRNAKPGLHQ